MEVKPASALAHDDAAYVTEWPRVLVLDLV